MRTFALTAAALMISGSAFASFTALDNQHNVAAIDYNAGLVGSELSSMLGAIDPNNDGKLTQAETAMVNLTIEQKFAVDKALRFQFNYDDDN